MDNCYLDALAVITFFKMSHKKHLFITGERGSGKSYLLNSILNQIEETMDMSDFLADHVHSLLFPLKKATT